MAWVIHLEEYSVIQLVVAINLKVFIHSSGRGYAFIFPFLYFVHYFTSLN